MKTSPAPAAAASPDKDALAEFILSFAQALLRAGYYFPEHPQAQRAKEGLYQRFRNLFHGRNELTLMVQALGETTGVLVEGALPEPQKLTALMPAGMADVYAPRLAHFLERHDLVSLTLNEGMAEDEFSRFIDVMSEPGSEGLDAKGKERFLARLQESGVGHFSLVFKEDVVTADRKLPWRAQLAISRLRKDLTHVPIFHDLDEAGLRALRREILHDVLRPVARADLLAAILMNSDLAETHEASAAEIEEELAHSVPDPLVLPTARAALQVYLPAAEVEPEAAARQRRALLTLLLHPRSKDPPGVLELVRDLYDRGLVELEQLPAALKAQVTLERDTDRFLSDREAALKALEQAATGADYAPRADALVRLVPELVRRGLLDEVLVIVTTVRGHAALGGERAPAAEQALARLAIGEPAAVLKDRFVNGKKEDRLTLGPVYQAIGERGRPHLVSILEESQDAWVRKNAAEVLLRMGPEGTQAVLAELAGGRLPPDAIAELVMVLGELRADAPEVRKALSQHAQHREPRVRQEAAWALCRIAGAAEEPLFLRLLDDPAPEVRQRALRCLRTARCAGGLARVVDMLERVEGHPALEAFEPQLYAALPELAEASGGQGGHVEALLIERLRDSAPHGLLRRARHPLTDDAFAAVCDALGFAGTPAALEALKDLTGHLKEPARQHVARAIERLEARRH